MRPDRVSATKPQKVRNRRVNALSGLSKFRPDLQYQWVFRKAEYHLNGYLMCDWTAREFRVLPNRLLTMLRRKNRSHS